MESLATFVYGELHRQVLKRRREWFELIHEAYTACWWVPVGQRPTTADAEERILHLREHGPTPYAFTLRESFAAPDEPSADNPRAGDADWLCPT